MSLIPEVNFSLCTFDYRYSRYYHLIKSELCFYELAVAIAAPPLPSAQFSLSYITPTKNMVLFTLEISCLFLNVKAHHLNVFLIDKEQTCNFFN